MNTYLSAGRSLRRVTDKAALRVLVNAQTRANEMIRQATSESESLRDDAHAYVRAITYEAAVLREEAEAMFERAAEAVGGDAPVTVPRRTIDLERTASRFDRYIDLAKGEDPAQEPMSDSLG